MNELNIIKFNQVAQLTCELSLYEDALKYN